MCITINNKRWVMSRYLKSILFILGVGNLIYALGIITNIFTNSTIFAVNSIITVISVIGIYKYRKWGVYLYVLSFLVALIYFMYLKSNFGDYIGLLINLILIYPVKHIWKEFK
jgi:hypothetical protein